MVGCPVRISIFWGKIKKKVGIPGYSITIHFSNHQQFHTHTHTNHVIPISACVLCITCFFHRRQAFENLLIKDPYACRHLSGFFSSFRYLKNCVQFFINTISINKYFTKTGHFLFYMYCRYKLLLVLLLLLHYFLFCWVINIFRIFASSYLP